LEEFGDELSENALKLALAIGQEYSEIVEPNNEEHQIE
jgi:hypothetical protein